MDTYVRDYIAYHVTDKEYGVGRTLPRPHRCIKDMQSAIKREIETELYKSNAFPCGNRLDALYVSRCEDIKEWGRLLYAPRMKTVYYYNVVTLKLNGHLIWADIGKINHVETYSNLGLTPKWTMEDAINDYWQSLMSTNDLQPWQDVRDFMQEGLFWGNAEVISITSYSAI